MNLSDKVKEVNKTLDGFGAKAVQVDTSKAYKSIGYKPQYLIDAMNDVFGVGGWFHETISFARDEVQTAAGKQRTSISVIMKVSIILDDGKVFTTGQQAGGSFVQNGSFGDAFKSAITDGLGKCLSLLGVGNKAYRGELQATGGVTVIKEDGIEEEIAAEVTGVTAAPAVITQTAETTTPRFSGFKSKTNGSAGAPENKAAEAPTARFRSPGLTQKASA